MSAAPDTTNIVDAVPGEAVAPTAAADPPTVSLEGVICRVVRSEKETRTGVVSQLRLWDLEGFRRRAGCVPFNADCSEVSFAAETAPNAATRLRQGDGSQ